MKIAICDDNRKDRENLFMKLHERFSMRQLKIQVDIYENAEQLLKNQEKVYAIYFLDIYMEKIDGIQLAKQINRLHKHALIILTTTSMQHYAEGFEIGAIHYLVKPYAIEDLEVAISRCLKIITVEEPYIEIMVERENKKILYSWITLIESQNRYCIIQTAKQQFKTYQQLSELEGLLEDKRFLRCHRSYIVNLDFVADYQNGMFLMKNGLEIPIKRGDRKKMKQLYEDYFFEKMRMQFGKERSTEAAVYAAPSYSIFLLIFTLFSYPFVYHLLKTKLQNALDILPSRSFWQLCITPILFFAINMVYVNIFARSNFQDGEMFIIYILILIVGSIIYIVSLNTALDVTEATRIQSDMEFLQRQMALQAENYAHLIESIETTKKAQHDLRHHMAVIGAYVEQDDKSQLEKYLQQYAKQLPKENDIPICSNYAVDVVVHHHLAALKDIDVKLDIKLCFTGVRGISDADLCILFGNLIENSVNSILKQQSGKKFIHAECSVVADKFMIFVDNSCDQHHMQKHGIGQHSIIAVANAYQGSARFELKDNVYRNSVILKLK